jgi:hypothetical protein
MKKVGNEKASMLLQSLPPFTGEDLPLLLSK